MQRKMSESCHPLPVIRQGKQINRDASYKIGIFNGKDREAERLTEVGPQWNPQHGWTTSPGFYCLQVYLFIYDQ